ncbi:hypothetical protein HD806DRAFT_490274 [Xylariaceae sp. AK1471]|nr:hypothetical protein HD806DRAFT_490274 [Xylariaceae sp. AK1471]
MSMKSSLLSSTMLTLCLALKGYEIGSASKLHVGDVFEFLWADAAEFQWEWKCLGYTRFIVLRHSKSFPHHCVCIPISTGGASKHEFAKPGIDSFQQGYVFANGDPSPGYEQPKGGPKLQYSPVGIELRPGRLRVKEDSRANYADIVQVDHDSQVMVVGDVVKYFDRVRRNVNKAFMRQILRTALEKYQAEKATTTQRPGSIMESVDGDHGGAECRELAQEVDRSDTYTLNEGPTDDEREGEVVQEVVVKEAPPENKEEREKQMEREKLRRSSSGKTPSITTHSVATSVIATPLVATPRVSTPQVKASIPTERAPSSPEERRLKPQTLAPATNPDYDLRSMHNVAMAGLK